MSTAPLDRPPVPLGAYVTDRGTHFSIWAPRAQRIELVIGPEQRAIPLRQVAPEVYGVVVAEAVPGTLYKYRLNGDGVFPDPRSRYQPQGVHGPSMVVDPKAYAWQDASWGGIHPSEQVIYELHVGCFSEEGTYTGLSKRLPYLLDLGVTTIELMPIHDFPGRWNWGYDPAAYYAPSRAYGTCDELRAMVDEAHRLGLAVMLDVVYNHTGPDGCYLPAFCPEVFSERHHTPWGRAINLDGPGSAGVRRFFIENALSWLQEYHMDGLRLDATHALIDDGPTHFLAELTTRVAALPGPKRWLVAEDARNERSVVTPVATQGLGLDAVWVDDFHHQMRCTLTQEHEGYYGDFTPGPQVLARCMQQGWLYKGQFSRFQNSARGTDPAGIDAHAMVYCIQNHDQIGNRAQGDRLHAVVEAEFYRVASAMLLFAPQTPMLFMGQEWAATSPFQFFTDHAGDLGKQVSAGRRAEFAHFASFGGDIPDPQKEQTFLDSCLPWLELAAPVHAGVRAMYKDLLRLRREIHGRLVVAGADANALVLNRDRHTLVAAFAEDIRVAQPRNSVLVWHTELPAYVEAGSPPVVEGGFVHCPKALCALFRRDP